MSNNVERALACCIALDPIVVGGEVLNTFGEENPFTNDVVWRVYNAWRVLDPGQFNPVLIADLLEERATYKVDWLMEVRSLMNELPSIFDWQSYLSVIKNEWLRRRATEELERSLQSIQTCDDVSTHLLEIGKGLAKVDTLSESDGVNIEQEVDAEIARLEQGEAFSTGIPAIDAIIGKLEPGEVFTIAALTGVGKSLLAVNIVRHMSVMLGVPGLYFSFEMNPAKHVARIAASLTHHDSRKVLMMYKEGIEEVVDAYKRVYGSPIIWDKRPRLTPQQICNKVARDAVKHGIKYSIVDTLDFVKFDGRRQKNEAIGDFIKDWKATCVEHGVIPILLVQINRSAKNSDSGIGLHHLKDSSAIEQDSSQVLLLDRETTLTQEERERVDRGEPITLKAAGAKSRYDMTGFRNLALFLHSSLIQDRAHNEDDISN